MTADEIFHQRSLKQGGRLDTDHLPSDIPDAIKRYLIHYRNRFQSLFHPPNPANEFMRYLARVQDGIINSVGLNAVAFSQEGIGFLGLTGGAPLVIHNAFQGILINGLPSGMPPWHPGYWKDAKLETHPQGFPISNDFSFSDSARVAERFFLLCRPTANCYGYLMAGFAIDFLLEHETAHLMRGHCPYLEHKSGHSLIQELGAYGAPFTDDKIIRNVLEHDADMGAALTGVLRLNNPEAMEQMSRYVPAPYAAQLTVDDLAYAWCFAVFVLFKLFAQYDRTGYESHHKTGYPHPMVRAMSICGYVRTFLRHLNKASKVEEDRFFRSWKRAVSDVESIWTQMKLPDATPSESLGSDMRPAIKKLYDDYNAIVPEVRRFSPIEYFRLQRDVVN